MNFKLYVAAIIIFILVNSCGNSHHLHLIRTDGKNQIDNKHAVLSHSPILNDDLQNTSSFNDNADSSFLNESELEERIKKDESFSYQNIVIEKLHFDQQIPSDSLNYKAPKSYIKISKRSMLLGILSICELLVSAVAIGLASLYVIPTFVATIFVAIVILLALSALITGIIGIVQIKKRKENGLGFSITGIVCGLLILYIMISALFVVVY